MSRTREQWTEESVCNPPIEGYTLEEQAYNTLARHLFGVREKIQLINHVFTYVSSPNVLTRVAVKRATNGPDK